MSDLDLEAIIRDKPVFQQKIVTCRHREILQNLPQFSNNLSTALHKFVANLRRRLKTHS